MSPSGDRTSPRVVLLFTSFPVFSETFLQREVRGIHQAGLPMEIVSLWGGASKWEGFSVEKNTFLHALASILWIPYWLVRRPREMLLLLRKLWRPRGSGFLNWGENLLGAGYALRTANRWQASAITHFHGVWASAPAMAAHALHSLTGIPFSFAGHAYDLFERGGDGWLQDKIQDARFVRTSTGEGRRRLLAMGAPEDKVLLIRRGLQPLPPRRRHGPLEAPFRFLSVGRMVEKMGFDRQIPLLAELKKQGLSFSMTWIGDGPERPRLEAAIRTAGLESIITLRGKLPYADVEQAYEDNEVFLFTGRIDSRGDRAGLPNAVAEAMAWGLLVFATDVGATSEAVRDRQTGFLWSEHPCAEDVLYALQEPEIQKVCRDNARQWIEANFDLRQNLGPLIARLAPVTLSISAC